MGRNNEMSAVVGEGLGAFGATPPVLDQVQVNSGLQPAQRMNHGDLLICKWNPLV